MQQASSASTAAAADPGRALEHGGRIEAARRRFPGAPEPFIDLSTGINPVPYAPIDLAPETLTRLPEPEHLDALRRAASLAYRVADPAMVVAAPGTQLLISLLPYLLPHRHVAILGPTYGEHLAAWHAAGADAREVLDIDALRGADVAVIGNPNNPDGRRTPPATLLDLAATVRLLIVDEAFADVDPDLGLAPFLPHPAILILRSFGKMYGLAGLRLGFALTAPQRAARMTTALGPWAVAGPAIALGRRALADHTWLAAARDRLARDTSRLDALLADAGLHTIGGTTLFRLVQHPRAASIVDRLGRAGILVRSFQTAPDRLRFGLPAPGEWDRLQAALTG